MAAGIPAFAMLAQQASYELPTTLSYYGTIVQESGVPFPAANYVTDNPINDGAFIWVPVGSKVMYQNTSAGSPTAYSWNAPGGTFDDATAEDLIVTYSTAGTYDFPTLTATYSSGDEDFSYDLKIKVGGKAELCHSDTREWNTTYALGYAPYGSGNGYCGGSNKMNVAGWGNFYRFSSADMFVDAVNVYVAKKPESFADGTNIQVKLYLPYITDTNFSMIGLTGAMGVVDGDIIPMADCKTAEDGVFVPTSGAGVYRMDCSSPLSCEGYPYLFFAIEGFSYDPTVTTLEEDFMLLTDVLPYKTLTQVEYSNALAHNSFGRYGSESDYIRPVTTYGGTNDLLQFEGIYKSYSFWICPVVRGSETPFSGIGSITVDDNASTLSIETAGSQLTVTGAVDGTISIYGINGSLQTTAYAANGGAIFNVSSLAPGIYIVRAADGATAKFVK